MVPENPRKILIIQTAFLGDVILATPVVEKLAKHYPEASIDFLLRKGNEDLFNGHPKIRKVIIRNKKDGKIKSVLRILKVIRNEKYDIVVNLHRFASSGFLATMAGARYVCGFDKNPMSFAYNHKTKHEIGNGVHEVSRNISAITHFTDAVAQNPVLYPSDSDFQKVAIESPYVCIAPTSVWFTKQWPAKKWNELIELIPNHFQVHLLGGPGDRDACEEIRKNAKRDGILNRAGELTLLESAALMKNAAMNYVNDSAPMHMASAMNAPVTAVYCSTVPAFGFGPLSERSWIMEEKTGLSCRPCGLHGFRACPQKHFRCSDIDPKGFPLP